jgi:hypothetical protein
MKQNTVYYLFALLFSQITVSQITVDDPEIKKMITEVKAESLKYTVENSFLWNSTYLKRYKE